MPAAKQSQSSHRWAERVLIAAFGAMLCAPVLAMVVAAALPALKITAAAPEAQASFAELRGLLPRHLTRRDLGPFPGAFRKYFEENFGFRQGLITWQGRIKVRLLGTSSSPKVVLGKAGWLYYAEERGIEDYRCVKPFTEAELAQWQEVLEQDQRWLLARGIPFVFFVAPNKHTIHPEHLPRWMDRVGAASRLDQLIRRLRTHTTIDVLDVRPALLEAAASGPVYFLTDTHWNEYGAFLAYQQVARGLQRRFPSLAVEDLSAFERTTTRRPGGDLARFLGLQDDLTEDLLRLVPHTQRRMQSVEEHGDFEGRDIHFRARLATTRPGGEIPRAVFFRDSFSELMVPFLSEHIGRAVYVWSMDLDRALIERERPDLVVLEFIERVLMREVPSPMKTSP